MTKIVVCIRDDHGILHFNLVAFRIEVLQNNQFLNPEEIYEYELVK